MDGARPGDFVAGEAMVTRITRSIVFVQGSVRCGDRVLLTASGLWKRLQGSPDSAVPVRQHLTTTHAKPRP